MHVSDNYNINSIGLLSCIIQLYWCPPGFNLASIVNLFSASKVIVEKAERSDIPNIDKKK